MKMSQKGLQSSPWSIIAVNAPTTYFVFDFLRRKFSSHMMWSTMIFFLDPALSLSYVSRFWIPSKRDDPSPFIRLFFLLKRGFFLILKSQSRRKLVLEREYRIQIQIKKSINQSEGHIFCYLGCRHLIFAPYLGNTSIAYIDAPVLFK